MINGGSAPGLSITGGLRWESGRRLRDVNGPGAVYLGGKALPIGRRLHARHHLDHAEHRNLTMAGQLGPLRCHGTLGQLDGRNGLHRDIALCTFRVAVVARVAGMEEKAANEARRLQLRRV